MQHRCTTTEKKILFTALESTVVPTEVVATVQVEPAGLDMRHVEGGKPLRNTTAYIAGAKSESLGSVRQTLLVGELGATTAAKSRHGVARRFVRGGLGNCWCSAAHMRRTLPVHFSSKEN